MHRLVMLLGAAGMLVSGLASPAGAASKADCEIRYAVCAQSCDREVPSLQQKCRQVCRSNKYRCLKNAS